MPDSTPPSDSSMQPTQDSTFVAVIVPSPAHGLSRARSPAGQTPPPTTPTTPTPPVVPPSPTLSITGIPLHHQTLPLTIQLHDTANPQRIFPVVQITSPGPRLEISSTTPSAAPSAASSADIVMLAASAADIVMSESSPADAALLVTSRAEAVMPETSATDVMMSETFPADVAALHGTYPADVGIPETSSTQPKLDERPASKRRGTESLEPSQCKRPHMEASASTQRFPHLAQSRRLLNFLETAIKAPTQNDIIRMARNFVGPHCDFQPYSGEFFRFDFLRNQCSEQLRVFRNWVDSLYMKYWLKTYTRFYLHCNPVVPGQSDADREAYGLRLRLTRLRLTSQAAPAPIVAGLVPQHYVNDGKLHEGLNELMKTLNEYTTASVDELNVLGTVNYDDLSHLRDVFMMLISELWDTRHDANVITGYRRNGSLLFEVSGYLLPAGGVGLPVGEEIGRQAEDEADSDEAPALEEDSTSP